MKRTPTPPNEQSRDVRQPFRSRPAGVLMTIGAAFLVAAALANLVISFDNDYLHTSDIVLIGLAITFATMMVRKGQKMMTKDAARVLEDDARPPIIYLRPFNVDEQERCIMPLSTREGGREVKFVLESVSPESKLAHALKAIGPFVAIGAPGETLATVGAARMYLADAEWQAKVDELLQRAAAVVLQPETSAGTRWEVMRVATSIDPRRVLLVAPNPAYRPLGYARIRSLIAADFPVSLPADCVAADFFMFDHEARPIPLVLRRFGHESLAPFIAQVQALDRGAENGRA